MIGQRLTRNSYCRTALQAASSRFEQFRALSSSFLLALSGWATAPPNPCNKRLQCVPEALVVGWVQGA
eukprot:960271-Alexandrium_andersonii.AAC.1